MAGGTGTHGGGDDDVRIVPTEQLLPNASVAAGVYSIPIIGVTTERTCRTCIAVKIGVELASLRDSATALV